ncbi:MAG: LPS export ABC transporter periplasmic protein LptC [Acetobacteraceae bacterium]
MISFGPEWPEAMDGAPRPAAREPRRLAAPELAHIVGLGLARRRTVPSPASLARRRWRITWAKRLLPLLGLALLASITLWPDLDGGAGERVSFHVPANATEGGGKLIDAEYNSVNQHGEPYTVTAAKAVQAAPDRVNLAQPKGDITLQSGSWVLLEAKQGVYGPKSRELDLSGDVTLYRDDGTTLRSSSATVDLGQGAAASGVPVSAEGPFGTLDATGFSLFDGGAVIQFYGPARLILNERTP